MSFQLATKPKRQATHPIWANGAFVVETIVLLAFLIASLAIFMQLFAGALERSQESGRLSSAVAAASSVAEHFAADPTGTDAVTQADGLVVTCDVEPVLHENGTLYRASIAVYGPQATVLGVTGPAEAGVGEPLYTITTAAYESEVS